MFRHDCVPKHLISEVGSVLNDIEKHVKTLDKEEKNNKKIDTLKRMLTLLKGTNKIFEEILKQHQKNIDTFSIKMIILRKREMNGVTLRGDQALIMEKPREEIQKRKRKQRKKTPKKKTKKNK